jgi:2'-5' RNA ligase
MLPKNDIIHHMPYAIELYFDPETERAIREFRGSLARGGIRPILDEFGDRPHISLALVADLDVSQMVAELRGFAANIPSFPTTLRGIDSFPGDEGVIFLEPTTTEPLLAAHAVAHQILSSQKLLPHEYYLPGRWTPHCTVAYGVEPRLMGAAVESARHRFRPIDGTVSEIGMVFYRPVRPICSFGLCAQAI